MEIASGKIALNYMTENQKKQAEVAPCTTGKTLMETDISEIVKRVQKGMELLDAHKPGWQQWINLETLDTCSLYDCILGQLYGHWDDGCGSLKIRIGDCWEYGFDTRPFIKPKEKYTDLREAWRRGMFQRDFKKLQETYK